MERDTNLRIQYDTRTGCGDANGIRFNVSAVLGIVEQMFLLHERERMVVERLADGLIVRRLDPEKP